MLFRRKVTEPFPGSVVEFFGDGIALVLRQLAHAGVLWDVLSNQSVGIFARASFPGVVRR